MYDEGISYLKEQKWYRGLLINEKNEIVSGLKEAADNLVKKSFDADYDLNNKLLDAIYSNGSQAEDIVDIYLGDKFIDLTADANNDGKVEKSEFIIAINDMDISNEEAWDLYLGNYDGKNAQAAKQYGVDARVYAEAMAYYDKLTAEYKGKGTSATNVKKARFRQYLKTISKNEKEIRFIYGTKYKN